MEETNFYVKVVGIIFDPTTRRILVGKDNGDKMYSFLEGDLSNSEELDKCLKRTIKEKTGFTAHNLGAIYAENMLHDPQKIKLHFLCEVREGQEKLGEGVEEIIWVKPSEVEEKIGVKLPSRLHEYVTNLE